MRARGGAGLVETPVLRAGRVVFRGEHLVQDVFHWAIWISEKLEAGPQRRLVLAVEDMENETHEKLLCGEVPVVLVSVAVWIHEHVGDDLHVAHFAWTASHFEQRVETRGAPIPGGWIEAKADAPELPLPPT